MYLEHLEYECSAIVNTDIWSRRPPRYPGNSFFMGPHILTQLIVKGRKKDFFFLFEEEKKL